MSIGRYHYCRWCGKQYNSKKWSSRAGFCSNKHKQAHYRAYKNYVTNVPAGSSRPGCQARTAK